MSKQKLKKISSELKKASNLHAGQAKKIDNMINKKSPTLKKPRDTKRKVAQAHYSKAKGYDSLKKGSKI